MSGGGGETARHAAHAAHGKMRVRRGFLEKPETIVNMPDGSTMTLRRSEADVVPLFRKFDPKRFNSQTGKLLGKGKRDSGGSHMSRPGFSFSRLLISAFLVHQAYSFLRDRFWRGRSATSERRMTLPSWDEVTEDDLDDEHRAKLAATRNAQSAMTRAMLRNAMPKPKRQGLPQKAKQAHQSRPKQFATARQKMHPPNKPQTRPSGMLQRVDEAVQRSVRQEMASVRQHEALPAAAAAAARSGKI